MLNASPMLRHTAGRRGVLSSRTSQAPPAAGMTPCCLDRQPGLADTRGADHRNQSIVLDQSSDRLDVCFPAHQRRRYAGKIASHSLGGSRGQVRCVRLQRRIVP